MLKEAVFPETIENIKSEQLSIELVFATPQDFEIGKSKGSARSVRLDRMLILLSGERAETATGKYVTVFMVPVAMVRALTQTRASFKNG
jgi:hypothetical protein